MLDREFMYQLGKKHALNSSEYSLRSNEKNQYLYDEGFWDGEQVIRARGYIAAHNPECSERATKQNSNGNVSEFFSNQLVRI